MYMVKKSVLILLSLRAPQVHRHAISTLGPIIYQTHGKQSVLESSLKLNVGTKSSEGTITAYHGE
jgi:hypothetical protein